ncbi:MAG TPA: protein-disulfide reductase DsbD domain-containing protein, partial [Gammaproteobacteria bacterium]|nr:protein-disulfide reductase DsbD domain-containing protein [Gammaproteobacteria bacterium]
MHKRIRLGRCGSWLLGVLGFALLAIGAGSPAAQAKLLQPEQAFQPSAQAVGPGKVRVTWKIADGCYLYRDKLHLTVVKPAGARVAHKELPQAEKEYDEVFKKTLHIYRHKTSLTADLEGLGGAREITVKARYQGCADAGVCYPPQTKRFTLSLPAASDTAAADDSGSSGASAGGGNLLSPQKAFKASVSAAGPDRVKATWDLADGYYLYRDKLDLKVVKPKGIQVADKQVPQGKAKYDKVFKKTLHIFRHQTSLTANLARKGTGAQPVTVELHYQGCADAGVCYPPQTKRVQLTLPAAGGSSGAVVGGGGGSDGGGGPGTAAQTTSEQSQFAAALQSGGFLSLGIFFLAGLGLAFTPCIFPMVPILSGIIVGSGGSEGVGITKGRAFVLSLAYVLGVAVTYSVLGVIAGATGSAIQAALQSPWVIGSFAAVFV